MNIRRLKIGHFWLLTPGPAVASMVATLALLSTAHAELVFKDDSGHEVRLKGPAKRIITLAPHATEMLYAAGAGDRLVGVMRYSDTPPQAALLPVIGDAFAVNLEAVAALKPDLLLVWRSGVNPRQQQRLRTLGVPVYESETRSVEGIAETLRRIGRLLGSETAAEAAAQQSEVAWHTLRTRYAGRTPVRVFFQMWHEPLMTVNQSHLIDQAMRACGGLNVFAQQPGLTPTVSWEAAVATNPQAVITVAARDEPARLENWRSFARVDAVRRGKLLAIQGDHLVRMTPRFIEGAQALCEAIDSARR